MVVPSTIILAQNILGKITSGDIFLLVSVVILIFCSAFCSASETAYSSSNSLRLKSLAEEKRSGARKAIYIAENFERALSCILTFNNLVNIACTTIAGYLFGKFILNPTISNLLNTVVLTVIILIFGEIFPKAKAKANPEKYALKFSGGVYFLLKYSVIYYPFYWLQRKMTKRKESEVVPTVTETELESIIDTMEEEGVIDHDNKEILQGAISLGEQSAYDVMTHRKDVVFVEENDEVESVKKLFIEYQYSRLPVYSGTRDNVVGVLNQKDFFTALLTSNRPVSIKKLMTTPHFISEEMKLDDVIRELQKAKKHLAIVIDEQGGTSGLVTLEDCIECMVGEIYDEHDEEQDHDNIQQLEDGSFIIDADTELTELFDVLEIEHIPESNYTTVGGLIFEKSEELCDVNDVVNINTIDEQIDEHGNFISKAITLVFTILAIESKKITQLKLEIIQEEPVISKDEE